MAAQSLCSIPGCDKPARSRGWCHGHYVRWRRHGDPFGGNKSRAQNGEHEKFYRDVVLQYHGNDCLIWPFGRTGHGYALLQIDGHRRPVHRLVCEEANGPPPTPEHEAAHNCGHGHLGCVTRNHMQWKTHAENMADMDVHGTRFYGEQVKTAKLTEADILLIRELDATMRRCDIAEKFNVSRSLISSILNGHRWRWLK